MSSQDSAHANVWSFQLFPYSEELSWFLRGVKKFYTSPGLQTWRPQHQENRRENSKFWNTKRDYILALNLLENTA